MKKDHKEEFIATHKILELVKRGKPATFQSEPPESYVSAVANLRRAVANLDGQLAFGYANKGRIHLRLMSCPSEQGHVFQPEPA